MWTFFSACLSYLDVPPEEAEANCLEPVSFTTSKAYVIGRVETLGAAASPFVTDLVQLVVPDTDLALHQASDVRRELTTKSSDRVFQFIIAAVASTSEQLR